ncbi:hypothetical protein PMAYCL1PPCAC_05872, partial [Pristionchus mayeri]
MDLTDLPSDIIRKVVRVGHESIDNQRLVSYWFKYKLILRSFDRPSLPVLEWLSFDSTTRSMSMRIPTEFGQYYGFKIDHKANDINVISRPISSISETMSRIADRCSRIQCLELSLDGDSIEYNRLISEALSKVHIDE